MIEIIPNWHPIFVHFTVALFSVSTGLYVLSLLIPDGKLKEQWRTVARWNLWLGMAITVITVLTGWYAYNTVVHDEPSHLAMTDHRNWALVTASLFLIATVWSILRHRAEKEASPLLLLLLVVAMASLGSTAWRGGEVVYRYGLGVMSLPNTGQHEHMAESDGHGHDEVMDESKHGHEDSAVEPNPMGDNSITNDHHHDGSTPHPH
ncbi:MAG: DUF2231 domain-containing protein [Pseudomonadota bacterium]